MHAHTHTHTHTHTRTQIHMLSLSVSLVKSSLSLSRVLSRSLALSCSRLDLIRVSERRHVKSQVYPHNEVIDNLESSLPLTHRCTHTHRDCFKRCASDTCTERWLELEKHPDDANKSDHANDAKQSCHAQKAGTQGVDHAMQYAESPPLDSGCCDLTYWYITWPLHTRYDLLIWPVTHSGLAEFGFFCTHCTHLL